MLTCCLDSPTKSSSTFHFLQWFHTTDILFPLLPSDGISVGLEQGVESTSWVDDKSSTDSRDGLLQIGSECLELSFLTSSQKLSNKYVNY